MVSQITPLGGLPLQSVGTSPKPAAARPAHAPASAPSAQASGSGSQEEAVAQVNQHLQQSQTELKLQVDVGSGRTVIQVVQQGTGQVVLQMPSDAVLGMSRRVRDMEGQTGSSGALVDKEG